MSFRHGTTEYRGIFHGTHRGAKSVVLPNTNLYSGCIVSVCFWGCGAMPVDYGSRFRSSYQTCHAICIKHNTETLQTIMCNVASTTANLLKN